LIWGTKRCHDGEELSSRRHVRNPHSATRLPMVKCVIPFWKIRVYLLGTTAKKKSV
jgi:hypothetical protein